MSSLGVPWHTQILADQLTLFQPGGGTDYAHLITTGTPGFSDLPTALHRISFKKSSTNRGLQKCKFLWICRQILTNFCQIEYYLIPSGGFRDELSHLKQLKVHINLNVFIVILIFAFQFCKININCIIGNRSLLYHNSLTKLRLASFHNFLGVSPLSLTGFLSWISFAISLQMFSCSPAAA